MTWLESKLLSLFIFNKMIFSSSESLHICLKWIFVILFYFLSQKYRLKVRQELEELWNYMTLGIMYYAALFYR